MADITRTGPDRIVLKVRKPSDDAKIPADEKVPGLGAAPDASDTDSLRKLVYRDQM